MAKLSMTGFLQMLADIDVPDQQIAHFLTIRADVSSPFNPIAVPDPAKVETMELPGDVGGEAAVATNMVCGWARWRRRRRFDRALALGASAERPIIYAEGDSWLQFPFLIRDLVDHLAEDHLVWCTSKPGDTLANMVFDRDGREYLSELHELMIERRLPVGAVLFSGAGNDVVGEDADGVAALSRIVRPYQADRDVDWHVATPGLEDTLRFIEGAYRRVLGEIDEAFPARHFPDLRVVIHGYDRAPTRSLPAGDPDRPVWARDWTGAPLAALGFPDNAAGSRVVAAVVDRVNLLTARVCAAFPRAVFADLRGSVPAGEWADELHPTTAGFKAAARRLRACLRAGRSVDREVAAATAG